MPTLARPVRVRSFFLSHINLVESLRPLIHASLVQAQRSANDAVEVDTRREFMIRMELIDASRTRVRQQHDMASFSSTSRIPIALFAIITCNEKSASPGRFGGSGAHQTLPHTLMIPSN